LADDFIGTGPDGKVYTKAQAIAAMKFGESVGTSSINNEVKVRIYGDAAVVISLWTTKETPKGKDTGGQSRWTDTWVKKAGRWQCVASHEWEVVQK
jgi:ketosteroid isomerase-like protein